MAGAAKALRAGAVVQGYRVSRVVGVGGFGVVYEAYHEVLDRRVALKEFFPSAHAHRGADGRTVEPLDPEWFAEALEKFKTTSRALSRLSHPNIVKVHGFEPKFGTAYMLMDFVDGWTLSKWRGATRETVDAAALRRVFEPVLDAVGYMHEQGVTHGDLSPDNIMLRAEPDGVPTTRSEPVLVDFGALKESPRADVTRVVSTPVFHPVYSPPEQTEGVRLGPRTPAAEVYSLGATAFFLASGAPPAPAAGRAGAIASGRQDPFVSLGERLDATAALTLGDLVPAVDAALRMRAVDRPRDVFAFKEALGWTTGPAGARRDSTDRAASPADDASSGSRPRSRAVFLGFSFGAAAVAAIAAVWVLSGPAELSGPAAPIDAAIPGPDRDAPDRALVQGAPQSAPVPAAPDLDAAVLDPSALGEPAPDAPGGGPAEPRGAGRQGVADPSPGPEPDTALDDAEPSDVAEGAQPTPAFADPFVQDVLEEALGEDPPPDAAADPAVEDLAALARDALAAAEADQNVGPDPDAVEPQVATPPSADLAPLGFDARIERLLEDVDGVDDPVLRLAIAGAILEAQFVASGAAPAIDRQLRDAGHAAPSADDLIDDAERLMDRFYGILSGAPRAEGVCIARFGDDWSLPPVPEIAAEIERDVIVLASRLRSVAGALDGSPLDARSMGAALHADRLVAATSLASRCDHYALISSELSALRRRARAFAPFDR